MICPRCEHHNPTGTIICAECGTYLKGLGAQIAPIAEPTTSVIQPDQALRDLQASSDRPQREQRPRGDLSDSRPQAPSRSLVPPEIKLHKLPAGPIKELFERGGVLDHKFALKRELGRGGMGFVFSGEDLSLGREVAVKVLPPHYNDDELVVRRFQREARAMASLDHPNIVTVYSIGDSDGLHYFVMKKLEGETLAHELKRQELGQKPRMSPSRAISLIQQVCSGLSHAHEKGILHRDIKPGNLMLSPSGFVSIMDFGIVKLLNTADTMSMQTAHGKIFGTPEYMSPEQAMGKGDYSPASDLYALAVVTYELLCGEIPFKGATPIEIILQHIRAAVPELTGELPRQLPELGPVLKRAMAKSAPERYASAAELSAALQAALQDAPAPFTSAHEPTVESAVEPAVEPALGSHKEPKALNPDHIQSDFQLSTLNLDEPESLELSAEPDELAELIEVDDIIEDELDELEAELLNVAVQARSTRGYEDLYDRHLDSPQASGAHTPVALPNAPFTQELSSLTSEAEPLMREEHSPITPPARQPVVLRRPNRGVNPVSTQPVSTQPVSTQPVSTQPVSTQPVSTQPPAYNPSEPPPIEPSAVEEPAAPPPERLKVEVASERKGHYRGLPIRRKGN